MSWLLVACVPGLLMLAALGLGRLESDLPRPSGLSPSRPSRPRHAAPVFGADFRDRGEVTLPTRIQADSRSNPQFQGTGRVNRV